MPAAKAEQIGRPKYYSSGKDVLSDCQAYLTLLGKNPKRVKGDVFQAGKCAGELMIAVDIMVFEADAFEAAHLAIFCVPDALTTAQLARTFVEQYPALPAEIRNHNGQRAVREAFARAYPCHPGRSPNGKRHTPTAVCTADETRCG